MSTPPPRPARTPSALPSVLVALLAVGALLGATVGAATLSGAPSLDLQVTSTDARSISVAWTSTSPDARRFVVYRDGVLVAATPLHQFAFGGLTCGTTHHLGVTALDARSNTVAQAAVDAATAACAQPQRQPGQDTSFAAALARSLDGSGDSLSHPDWGRAGTPYERLSRPNYADGRSAMVSGPSPRRISNRIFNDLGQNLFSENGISQWGWAWGQFIDHDMDLRDERAGEPAPMPFDASDPLESFSNEAGQVDFSRTPAAPGTGPGTSRPRQQINTISSFLDASQVYGTQDSRLQWLRAPNSPDLLLPDGYLPRADDGSNGRARRQSRVGNRRRRRTCEREPRTDIAADALRARAAGDAAYRTPKKSSTAIVISSP